MTIDEAYSLYSKAKSVLGQLDALSTVEGLRAVVTFRYAKKQVPIETDATTVLNETRLLWQNKFDAAKEALRGGE